MRIRGGLKDKYWNDPLGFCRAIVHHAWNPENPPWASPPNWIANSSKKETHGSPSSSLTAAHSTSLPVKASQRDSSICINEEPCKRMLLLSCYHHYVSEYCSMNPLKTATQIFKSPLQSEAVVLPSRWQMKCGAGQHWEQPSLPSGDRHKLVSQFSHIKRLRKALKALVWAPY